MSQLQPSITALGFIGLGNMGSRIVARLLAAGYAVSAYDRNGPKRKALKEKGASVPDDIPALARSVQVVLSCLTNDQSVRDVYYGPEGVLTNGNKGLVILEMSTVSPATSSELAMRAAAVGMRVLDVAISGSTAAAENGALTLLAGGDADLFQQSTPIFQTIAGKYFHLGTNGCGTTMKLVVNAILGAGMQAIAEGINLGQRAGLKRDVLLQVLAQTVVVAPAFSGKLPRIANDDYSPQFPLALMNKDFRLILQLAADVRADMPATSASAHLNSDAVATLGEQDFSAVLQWLEQLSASQKSRRPARLQSA
jgi:3-hydroxyisobutyrate dehydrogenase